MTTSRAPRRAPLAARAAERVLSRIVNPHPRTSERTLRDAATGKVILVTGASYGIGEATARKLAAHGATVLLVARSADKLDEVAAGITAAGGTAYPHPADLTDPEAVKALASEILDRHGHVDVIVNNAGKSIRRSIHLSYDRFHDFQRTIDINYLGPVQLFLALLPSMRERHSGHIVNVSTAGVSLPPGARWAAYQASKVAFDVWLRSVALEVRAEGITVTSIYMPLVHTRMSAPTPVFRRMPGLSPDQAAGLVCHGIVARPKTIAPWWLTGAEVTAAVARGPLETAMGLAYRLTQDSASAQGGRPSTAPEVSAGSPFAHASGSPEGT